MSKPIPASDRATRRPMATLPAPLWAALAPIVVKLGGTDDARKERA